MTRYWVDKELMIKDDPFWNAKPPHPIEVILVSDLAEHDAQLRAQVWGEAVEACLNEKVDADSTKDEGDYAYNRACDDCAAALSTRGG